MVDVTTSITSACPLAVVSDFSSNPENATRWYKNIKLSVWKSEPPLSVGSLVMFRAHFLGRSLEYTYEVSKFEKGAVLIMRTSEGPFPMETTYQWEKVSEAETLMTLRNRGEPRGFSRIVAPLMQRMMRKANEEDLLALKTILEKNKE